MRKYVITINDRKYVTTDMIVAMYFCLTYDVKITDIFEFNGNAIPDVVLAHKRHFRRYRFHSL